MQRWQALDELRGLATMCLIAVMPFFDFRVTPKWLEHAPSDGLRPPDLILPVFLFVLGVAYRLSFEKRRQEKDRFRLTLSFLRRYGLFVLFGLLGESRSTATRTFIGACSRPSAFAASSRFL
jgi:predicted acyltransferase